MPMFMVFIFMLDDEDGGDDDDDADISILYRNVNVDCIKPKGKQ